MAALLFLANPSFDDEFLLIGTPDVFFWFAAPALLIGVGRLARLSGAGGGPRGWPQSR